MGLFLKGSRKVYRLHKVIYALKQSPKAWFGKFSESMLVWIVTMPIELLCVFSYLYKRKILLIVYVDDIIIIGDDKKGINDLKRYLQNTLRTTDLGKHLYFLRIEVAQSKEGISLFQRKSVLDI